MTRGKITRTRPKSQLIRVQDDTTELHQDALGDMDHNADLQDMPDPKDPTGNEIENGPQVDPGDPNLSAVMAEAGTQEERASLGMRGEDEMELDDPEKME